MRNSIPHSVAVVVLAALAVSPSAGAQPTPAPGFESNPASALLAVDQHRATIVERIVVEWGERLTASTRLGREALQGMLLAMRADRLLAASLAGSLEGLRDVIAHALLVTADPGGAGLVRTQSTVRPQALGDAALDVVYTPVTPCRLVDTRTPYPAVYQNGGPFSPGEVRSYAVQGGNGVCLSQLPTGLDPSAVQLQVFGIPVSAASGDVEVLPQGSTFGDTATLVFLGSLPFTSASTTARINLANDEIAVQVRGGPAHVAIDVVGYFRAPRGGYVASVAAGAGIAVGGTAGNPTVTADTTYLQRRVSSSCPPGNSIRAIDVNGIVSCEVDDAGAANAFVQNGNAFGAPAVVGTTDAQPMTVRSGGGVVILDAGGGNGMRVTQTAGTFADAPNLVAGSANNDAGGQGAAVGGGGAAGGNCFNPQTGVNNRSCGNHATANYATVAGGYANLAGGAYSTVAGGYINTALGNYAHATGGYLNIAGGYASSVTGGYLNSASGSFATVAGGHDNLAQGSYSFAAGRRAHANVAGCFAWGDSTDADVPCNVADRFVARASGGYYLYTDSALSSGVFAAAGSGSWSTVSDRAMKANVRRIDPQQVLAGVAEMPIATWNYASQDASIRHMGPTAQDFRAAFDLGENETTISTVDAQGVALAAIQGLNAKLEAKLAEQARELAAQRAEIADLRRAMGRTAGTPPSR